MKNRQRHCALPWRPTPGTEPGIAARISTMERLSGRQNDECQIDAIPQAWAVISGAAKPARVQWAMDSVQRRLVRLKDKLIQLFDPPFDKGTLEPGYIKGYVPGIRENGGQYTHAATGLYWLRHCKVVAIKRWNSGT